MTGNSNKQLFVSAALGVIAVLGLLLFTMPPAHAQDIQSPCALRGGCPEGLQLSTLLDNRGITYSFVVMAGLIDGLNPCAVGLILVLFGCVIMCIHDRKHMTKIGAIYIGSIFATYFIVGVFFSHAAYTLMQWPRYPEVQQFVKWGIAAMLWISAVVNIIHFYIDRLDPDHTSSNAEHLFHRLRKLATHWPVAIGIGVLVTLFAMPCSLPLYVGSIAALAKAFTPVETLKYLFVYDLMFVAPLVIIFSIITRTHMHLEQFLHKENRWLHLVLAAASVIFGIVYLFI